MYIATAESTDASAFPETVETLVFVSALSAGALILAVRSKSRRATRTTHWAVLLTAHGGLAATIHFTAEVFHLGGALVIVAMAERVIWDVSDGLAERIDRYVGRQAPDTE